MQAQNAYGQADDDSKNEFLNFSGILSFHVWSVMHP